METHIDWQKNSIYSLQNMIINCISFHQKKYPSPFFTDIQTGNGDNVLLPWFSVPAFYSNHRSFLAVLRPFYHLAFVINTLSIISQCLSGRLEWRLGFMYVARAVSLDYALVVTLNLSEVIVVKWRCW